MVDTILTALGGGLIALVFKSLFRTKAESDTAIMMLVKQLQENVNSNNDKIIKLEDEVHEWRAKYYQELEEKNKLLEEIRKLRTALQKYNQEQTAKQ